MTKRLLIDGDILAMRATVGAEEEIDWGEDVWTLYTDLKRAKESFNWQVDALVKHARQETGEERVLPILALSHTSYGTPNWRLSILPTYKSNRAKLRKPVGYRAMLEWIEEQYDTLREPGFEADDLLGIALTDPKSGPRSVLWSPDKDLKQIPGAHLVTEGGEVGLVVRPRFLCDYYHLFQTLTGDDADGYTGCPGVGPKKAAGILAKHISRDEHAFDVAGAWQDVLAAYDKAGLTVDDALVQARVARIRRHGEGLWEPPAAPSVSEPTT